MTLLGRLLAMPVLLLVRGMDPDGRHWVAAYPPKD